MNDPSDHRSRFLFSDPILQEALSDVGVFIVNFVTGETLSSVVWRALEKPFRVDPDTREWIEQVHPDDRSRMLQGLNAVLTGEAERFDDTFRLIDSSGEWKWVKSYGRTVSRSVGGKPELYIGADFDITALKRTEERLRTSNRLEKERRVEIETLRSIAAAIGASLDLGETVERILAETRRIIVYDTATVQILHKSHLEVIGGYGFKDLDEILKLSFPFPEQGSLSTRAIQEKKPLLTNNVSRDFPSFVQPDRENPVNAWLGIPLIRHGDVIGLVALDSHTSGRYHEHHIELAAAIGDHIAIALENARLHEQTYQMAMEDSLTRAGSRHRFSIEGRLLFENAKRSKHPISVVLIDIDHFKRVNDTYGHDIGDIVLRYIARTCARELRTTDLFARYGGEEFVIVLPDTPETEAVAAAVRILEKIAAMRVSEYDVHVTVSAGLITGVPIATETLDQYIRRADEALYGSKRSGRNQLTVWERDSAEV